MPAVPESSSDLMIEITGVIPLPAAKATTSRRASIAPNVPAGAITSSTSPAWTRSFSQFETRPPGTRLTVICRSGSSPGVEDIE